MSSRELISWAGRGEAQRAESARPSEGIRKGATGAWRPETLLLAREMIGLVT